jgi:hypothetical protein
MRFLLAAAAAADPLLELLAREEILPPAPAEPAVVQMVEQLE